MMDGAFDPVNENENPSPQFNSVNPSIRYRSLAKRHGIGTGVGSVLAFMDGHAKFYTWEYITTNKAYGAWTYTYEAPIPDIIFNAAYRAALGR